MKYALLLLLTLPLLGQTAPVPVSAEEAIKHVIKAAEPVYPDLAQLARIQGNVILRVTVDEAGKPQDVELVRGHPMLAPAAKNAASQSRYRPFEVGGKPVKVVALVMVTFGQTGSENLLEFLLDDKLFFAQTEADRSNYAEADKYLGVAESLLTSNGGGSPQARFRLYMAVADVRAKEQKFEDVESAYQRAAAVFTDSKSPNFQRAEALEKLAALYQGQKHLDKQRETLEQAVDIYATACKKANCADDTVKQMKRKKAYASWELSKLATEQNDLAAAAKWCKNVFDGKKAFDSKDRDAALASCNNLKNGAGK